MPFVIIKLSNCQFERSREPLLHLDYARCDKKELAFNELINGIKMFLKIKIVLLIFNTLALYIHA
jgi:hypothetical protein